MVNIYMETKLIDMKPTNVSEKEKVRNNAETKISISSESISHAAA
jgi:hypothetical protein